MGSLHEANISTVANRCGFDNHKNGYAKLTPEAKRYTIARLAEGFSSNQVVDDLKRFYGVIITPGGVREFRRRKRSRQEIDTHRAELAKNALAIPIANKVTRLAYLQHLYIFAMTGQERTVTKADGTTVKTNSCDYGVALKAIRLAHEEMQEIESIPASQSRSLGGMCNPFAIDDSSFSLQEKERILTEWKAIFGIPSGNS